MTVRPLKTWKGTATSSWNSAFCLATWTWACGCWPSSSPALLTLHCNMLTLQTALMLFYTPFGQDHKGHLRRLHRRAFPKWPQAADCESERVQVLLPWVLSSSPLQNQNYELKKRSAKETWQQWMKSFRFWKLSSQAQAQGISVRHHGHAWKVGDSGFYRQSKRSHQRDADTTSGQMFGRKRWYHKRSKT